MLKKIGSKLLLTYFVILIITFTVTHFAYQFLSERYVVNETHKQLKSEGQAIAKMLSTAQLVERDVFKTIYQRKVLKTAQNFVEAEVIVLNKAGIIIYKSSQEITKQTLTALLKRDNSGQQDLISNKIPIYAKDNEIKGTVILFTKAKSVYELNNILKGAQFFSFAIAGIIALIIGVAFERSLTRPIYLLMNKMKDFSVNKKASDKEIRTGDEIQALDQSFKEMADKINQYDEMQKRLLQNASHELKTPLMSIQGYAEAIKDGIVQGKEIDDSLDIIIEQSQRLKGIVEELIYLTKLENPDEAFVFKKSNLQSIIEDSIKSIRPLLEDKGIQIHTNFNFNPIGIYDEEKLMRSFINILGNGARYAESKIDITAVDCDKSVCLSIQDDGSGFAQGEENKVFDRFYKGSKGNTGLGLAITKAVIEGHKGKIYAANNNTKGAIFKIELPWKE